MPCALPPQPDDGELLAYLDGEDRPEIEAHLRACRHCLDRARELAAYNDRLVARLYRFMCPSSLDLGEYVLGMLSAGGADGIEGHLRECPRCQAEVAQLRTYLADVEPDIAHGVSRGALDVIRSLVARLVSGPRGSMGTGAPSLVPALAGIRGEGEGLCVYRADEVQIALEVHEDADRPDRWILFGLVMGTETGDMTARLVRDGQEVAASEMTDLGNFDLSDLSSGSYCLTLEKPGLTIKIPTLEIRQ